MLFVGQSKLRGDLARYARSFDLLELAAEPGQLPRVKKLEGWPELVGERFVFSLRLSQRTWQYDPAQSKQLTEHTKAVAAALKARFVVVQTPASATPTTRNRSRLGELQSSLAEAGVQVAWEPHGLWEADEAVGWAEQLGLVLVRDLSRDEAPPGSTVYTRLLALGESSRVRSGDAQHVAEQVASRQQVYVVMEGDGARQAAQLLRQELTE
jgi:uncharacterized protein YecE (DUF72 family)